MRKIKKVRKTIETIEPLYKVNDVVMFKDNLLMVVIGEIYVKQNKYWYRVRYNHNYYENKMIGWFNVSEEELETKPLNYESLLMEKYIDYKWKYEHLCFELTRRFKNE